MKIIKIDWTFWKKEIFLEKYVNFWNENVIINIHWAFGETNEKYRRFAKQIFDTKKASVILASSSRLEEDNLVYKDEFEKKQSLFVWKTLKEEVEDFSLVLDYLLNNSEKLFWLTKDKIIFTINWNSLGWIIALYLQKEYKQIKYISLVWTGARLDIKWTTLLDSWPNILELKEICELFLWKLLLNFWTQDIVFDENSFKDMYSFFKCEKSAVKFIWADHSFKKINFEKSEIPYKIISQNILELIHWNLVSGEVNLFHYIDKNIILDEKKIQGKDLNTYFKKDVDWFWE